MCSDPRRQWVACGSLLASERPRGGMSDERAPGSSRDVRKEVVAARTSPAARTTKVDATAAANGANRLVIVESPAKARTIAGYLGKGYVVESSIGHIRDMPGSAADIPEKYRKEPWARLGVNAD